MFLIVKCFLQYCPVSISDFSNIIAAKIHYESYRSLLLTYGTAVPEHYEDRF